MSYFVFMQNQGHKRAGFSGQALFTIVLTVVLILSGALLGGPSGDYGDAPVGDNIDNIEAYPGVTSRFVSYYNHKNTVFMPLHDHGTYVNSGATFHLGVIPPTIKNDTQQDPALPENDCFPLVLLEGTHPTPGPNPMASMALDITTTATHDSSAPIYVNIFVDQNRDGQWKDGYLFGTQVFSWNQEWIVMDAAIYQNAGTTVLHTFSFFRIANPTEDVWIRVVLTDQRVGEMYRDLPPPAGSNFWDATMPLAATAVGEVEDFLLQYYSDPNAMPTNGIRVWGMILRRFLQPNPPPGQPKPDCFLFFAKANYARPFGDIRRRVIVTPWCMNGTIPFGLSFTTANLNGGCDNADAIVGLYGYKLVAGRGMMPVVSRTALGTMTLAAPPLLCPPAIFLPPAHPDDPPDFPKDDEGVAPVDDWRNGSLFWQVCYPDPPRYRRYASKLLAEACGSEIMNHSVVPGFDDPYNYSTVASAIEPAPGMNAEVHFVAGGLLERFEDPDELIPFPDPDFQAFSFFLNSPSGFADIFPDDFNTPPLSAKLLNGGYNVAPLVPDETRIDSVNFYYKGTGGSYQILGAGDPLAGTISPAESWQLFEIPIPDGLIVENITIEFLDGFIDDLYLPLQPYAPDAPFPIDDCNDNGVLDDIDIDEGVADDANGNFIPDECEGYVPPGECGDANGDGDINVSDAVWIINYVFAGGAPPEPLDIGDTNCDGDVNVSDAVWIINFVFAGGNPPCDLEGDGIPDC